MATKFNLATSNQVLGCSPELRHLLYSVAIRNPTAFDQSFFASLNEDDERKVLHVDKDDARRVAGDSVMDDVTDEKELGLIRLIKDGTPTYFTVVLLDYGHSIARNLKRAIDDVFLLNLKGCTPCTAMPQATMADEVAVNTCVFNGLMAQMKDDGRPWLLTIHCASHCPKLATKDSEVEAQHIHFVSRGLRHVRKQQD